MASSLRAALGYLYLLCCLSVVINYKQVYGLRFLVGLFEGTSWPGYNTMVHHKPLVSPRWDCSAHGYLKHGPARWIHAIRRNAGRTIDELEGPAWTGRVALAFQHRPLRKSPLPKYAMLHALICQPQAINITALIILVIRPVSEALYMG